MHFVRTDNFMPLKVAENNKHTDLIEIKQTEKRGG